MDIAHATASLSISVAPLDLHISIYVTCLCNPEAVPLIPNCDVTIIHWQPSLYKVILDLASHSETLCKTDLLKSGSLSPDISEPEKSATRDVETLDSEQPYRPQSCNKMYNCRLRKVQDIL